jgi:hypothetical protein
MSKAVFSARNAPGRAPNPRSNPANGASSDRGTLRPEGLTACLFHEAPRLLDEDLGVEGLAHEIAHARVERALAWVATGLDARRGDELIGMMRSE